MALSPDPWASDSFVRVFCEICSVEVPAGNCEALPPTVSLLPFPPTFPTSAASVSNKASEASSPGLTEGRQWEARDESKQQESTRSLLPSDRTGGRQRGRPKYRPMTDRELKGRTELKNSIHWEKGDIIHSINEVGRISWDRIRGVDWRDRLESLEQEC